MVAGGDNLPKSRIIIYGRAPVCSARSPFLSQPSAIFPVPWSLKTPSEGSMIHEKWWHKTPRGLTQAGVSRRPPLGERLFLFICSLCEFRRRRCVANGIWFRSKLSLHRGTNHFIGLKGLENDTYRMHYTFFTSWKVYCLLLGPRGTFNSILKEYARGLCVFMIKVMIIITRRQEVLSFKGAFKSLCMLAAYHWIGPSWVRMWLERI
jgi:hypothetical protein